MQPRHARRTHRIALAVAILALVVAACGAGASGDPASGGGRNGSTAAVSTATPPDDAEPLPDDIPVPAITASAAGPAGTGLVTITDGGIVAATADDGTEYVLEIPPGAVGEDVTVTLQPLGGATALGPVVAGADFAPAGLELAIPGTLTVQLPDPQPAGMVGLSYRGDAARADGRLLAGTGADTAGPILVFSVMHFSGSVASSVGSSGNTLYTTWSGTRDSSSPAGRQAVAETRYAAATLAEREGRISKETADGIRERATDDWADAEAERVGAEGDLDALGESVRRTLQNQHDAEVNGTASPTSSSTAMKRLVKTYETRLKTITDTLKSKEIQKTATSGRISDLETIHQLVVEALVVAREIELLDGQTKDTVPVILDVNRQVARALEKSCSDAPVPVSMLLGFKRVAALFGDEETANVDMATLERCNGATDPPPLDFGPFGADGRITYNTTWEDELGVTSYVVELDLKVREGEEALIFAKGSKFKATYTINPATVYGDGGEPIPYTCPKTYTWEGTMGTMGNSGGWDPGSDPSEQGSGFAVGGGEGDDLVLTAGVSVDPDAWPDGCTAPSVAFGCPDEYELIGKLVGAVPREWSFACSTPKGVNPFVSAGGRMIQVEVRE